MSNKIINDLQYLEALKRLKMLKLSKNVIKDFKDNKRVYYSERQNNFFDGILYWLDNEDRYVKEVEKFEKKHNALVYHAQLLHTEFGDMLSLLFVGSDKEEWQKDLDDIDSKEAFAYVINLDDDYGSEFGYIGIEPKNGGISRTW